MVVESKPDVDVSQRTHPLPSSYAAYPVVAHDVHVNPTHVPASSACGCNQMTHSDKHLSMVTT